MKYPNLRKLLLIFLPIVFLNCDKPTGPNDVYRVEAIKFRIFLNFNNSPEEPYYFWLSDENDWTGDMTTPRGSHLVLRCNNCPPPYVASPGGTAGADTVNLYFRIDGPGQHYEATFNLAEGYSRVFRDPDITVYYIRVGWQCIQWNFEHSMVCSNE